MSTLAVVAAIRARLRAAACVAVALPLWACTSLPQFGLPTGELRALSEYRPTDVIGYRALSRSDFRAESPPPAVAEHASRIGAYSCSNIVPAPLGRARVRPGGRRGVYVAEVEELAFRAELDRACSWWNDRAGVPPDDYVLQHEQIHFAIVELEARSLSDRVRRLSLEVSSPEQAPRAVELRIEALVREALERVLARHAEFDRDTSAQFLPERQERWYQRIEAELRRTE